MTAPSPWPLMPPKSTETRLQHFDEHVYRTEPNTLLFRFLDAMCGDAGAGNLKKEVFLQRLSGAMDCIYGNALDYIFGGVRFLSRSSSEAYTYDTEMTMLTSNQWDEVATKDAAYRDRIRQFFIAASAGGTVEGIRQVVHAATSGDCQVMENWRFIDDFGLAEGVGRALSFGYQAINLATGERKTFTAETLSAAEALADAYILTQSGEWDTQQCRARNEVTIVPHKLSYSSREARMLRDMLDRITPQDTIITISLEGIAVNSPVGIRACNADSTYYQVEKMVTGTPELDNLPPPELLAIDLDPDELWLKSKSPELAPYGRFNITSEYGYYYLASGGNRSPIDTVTYGTLADDGTVRDEPNFQWYEQTEQYGPWTSYEITSNPAYATQADYVAARKAEVLALGGQADDLQYRLPLETPSSYKRTYTPDLAIASTAPSRDSTVTSSWTSRKKGGSRELRNPATFVR